MTTFKEIYKRIYASWLGKNIGIRLGAPIESWTGTEVRKCYQPITDYLTDYSQFAADDDANGPLFFADVMKHHSIDDVKVQDMANNLLNVVPYEKGFFWWGGKGISTEHTAWLNLINHVDAPLSGSCKQNTKAVSEQIGGQIFSDCWGYLALDKPEIATTLAEKMSSVTHDLDGIEGGKFVAVCISLAWHHLDAREIITSALTYLNPDSNYAQLIREMLDFHLQYPNDTKKCLAYIEDKHSYDNYEGLCHILPNTAIMLYGMLYGKNDFDLTMQLIAEAGRDTDCNLGNVGSIIGMMVGIENINEKWIKPINDVLLCSSSIGTRNITTLSKTAYQFATLACKLHDIPTTDETIARHTTDFSLPYATNGFQIETSRYHACNLRVQNNQLKICLDDILSNQEFKLYKHSYFRPQDVYDCRYEPEFAAIIEPGDIIRCHLDNPEHLPLDIAIYIKGYSGKIYHSDFTQETDLEYHPNTNDIPYLEYGFIIRSQNRIQRNYFTVNNFEIIKQPSYQIDFLSLTVEDWGYDIGLKQHYGISGLRIHRGHATIHDNQFLLDAHSEFNFSGPDVSIHNMSLSWIPQDNIHLHMCYQWHGCYDYQSIEVDHNTVYLTSNYNRIITRKLITCMHETIASIDYDYNKQAIYINSKKFEISLTLVPSCVAILNESNQPIQLLSCRIEGK